MNAQLDLFTYRQPTSRRRQRNRRLHPSRTAKFREQVQAVIASMRPHEDAAGGGGGANLALVVFKTGPQYSRT
jgi:hypothetical protein